MKIDLKGKSYLILNHNEPITVEEMRELYDGFWVYVVNAEFSTGRRLSKGVPVVIGTCAFAGASEGIYEKYKSPEYGERRELILLKNRLIFSLIPAGVSNA